MLTIELHLNFQFYVATNCNIILIIMAVIFLLVGAVLTAISYRPKDLGEHPHRFIDRQVCNFVHWSAAGGV